ncbi:MAG: hypothetical protein FWH55_07630 [Oscillospiraceae bacterium]|nr:hypothetical protein [Oscillospiraceae bacterium]
MVINMVNVYYYVLNQLADDIVFSGLSMSKWAGREVMIGGSPKKCIITMLNPRDDMLLYKSPDHACIRISIPPEYCMIADKCLYEIGKTEPKVMKMYWDNLIPANEYRLGTFVKPEALVTATVIPGRIAIADRKADALSVIGDNTELYLNNHIESLKDKQEDIKNELLYHYYKAKVVAGKCVMLGTDAPGNKVIFADQSGGYMAIDTPF